METTALKLKQFIARIEKLEEEKAEIAASIREIYATAKSEGFDPKTMRSVLKLKKLDPEKRVEIEELLETYKTALGIE